MIYISDWNKSSLDRSSNSIISVYKKRINDLTDRTIELKQFIDDMRDEVNKLTEIVNTQRDKIREQSTDVKQDVEGKCSNAGWHEDVFTEVETLLDETSTIIEDVNANIDLSDLCLVSCQACNATCNRNDSGTSNEECNAGDTLCIAAICSLGYTGCPGGFSCMPSYSEDICQILIDGHCKGTQTTSVECSGGCHGNQGCGTPNTGTCTNCEGGTIDTHTVCSSCDGGTQTECGTADECSSGQGTCSPNDKPICTRNVGGCTGQQMCDAFDNCTTTENMGCESRNSANGCISHNDQGGCYNNNDQGVCYTDNATGQCTNSDSCSNKCSLFEKLGCGVGQMLCSNGQSCDNCDNGNACGAGQATCSPNDSCDTGQTPLPCVETVVETCTGGCHGTYSYCIGSCWSGESQQSTIDIQELIDLCGTTYSAYANACSTPYAVCVNTAYCGGGTFGAAAGCGGDEGCGTCVGCDSTCHSGDGCGYVEACSEGCSEGGCQCVPCVTAAQTCLTGWNSETGQCEQPYTWQHIQ